MKKSVSVVIRVIVLGVASYLLIANILQFFYLRQAEIFDFDSSQMNRVRSNYDVLERNIVQVKDLDSSVISEEDLIAIQESLDENLELIKKNKLLGYQGKKKIYLKDLLYLDMQASSNISSFIRIFNILEKYDDSIKEESNFFKDEFVATAYANESAFQNAFSGYQYHTPSFFTNNITEPANYKVLTRVYQLNFNISKLNYLTKIILEVGEPHV